MLGLAKLMPYEYSPIVLPALGGLLLSVGALAGPETKDTDFRRQIAAGSTRAFRPSAPHTAAVHPKTGWAATSAGDRRAGR
jgi:hypothetical protein